jgi:predicted RNA-binding Zn-ribbon protein involved in translation (DUF1610 family)
MKYSRNWAVGLVLLAGFAFGTRSASAAELKVSTGKVEAAAGNEVRVPVSVKGVKDTKGIAGMTLRVRYDPALLTFKELERGKVLPSAVLDKSVDEKADPGVLGLGFACGSKTPGSQDMASVEEDGVVLVLVFAVNDKAAIGQKCPLKLDNFRAVDNAEPPFELSVVGEDGEFTVVGPGFPIPWLWILIGVGVLILLLLILSLARRRGGKGQPGTYVFPPAMSASPNGAAAAYVPSQEATFLQKCGKCGGMVQLPRGMSGRAFRCGACGANQVAVESPQMPASPRYHPQEETFLQKCAKCGGMVQLPRGMSGRAFQCGGCGTKQVART